MARQSHVWAQKIAPDRSFDPRRRSRAVTLWELGATSMATWKNGESVGKEAGRRRRTYLAEGACRGLLVLGDLRATGDGVAVGGPSLLLDRLLLSVRASVNQSIASSTDAFAADAQCRDRCNSGGRALRANAAVHGKKQRDSKKGRGMCEFGWLDGVSSLLAGRWAGRQARRCSKKKLGMHGKGLVSHLADGGEAVASVASGRWSPGLVL